MAKMTSKVVQGFEGGHQVEFWIDQQGFRLQEVFDDGDMSSEEKAAWYKRQLDTALKRLKNEGRRK